MARLYNTFEFIGNIQIPKDQNRFHNVKTSDSGWEGHRLNFSIQESNTNSVFLELYGGFFKSKKNVVKTMGKSLGNEKSSMLEIPWDDRLHKETIDMVADFRKVVVDYTTDFELKEELRQLRYEIFNLERQDSLTENDKETLAKLKNKLEEKDQSRYEFIHNYDAINYLSGTLNEYKNFKFRVTGNVEVNHHNGKFYRKFNPTLFEIVSNDTPAKLRATMDIFFTKDALDETDFKDEKKIYVNGYIQSYDGNAKKDVFFPQQFIINATKVDFENEKHVGRFNFLKNKFNVKGKGVYHLQWEVNIFRGAESIEFTIDDLTADQREAVEFGFNKLDDFKPKGGLLGSNIEENRLVKPILKKLNESNDFTEGAVETSYEPEELEYTATERLPVTDVPNDPFKNESKKEVDINEELDDLFA